MILTHPETCLAITRLAPERLGINSRADRGNVCFCSFLSPASSSFSFALYGAVDVDGEGEGEGEDEEDETGIAGPEEGHGKTKSAGRDEPPPGNGRPIVVCPVVDRGRMSGGRRALGGRKVWDWRSWDA